MKIIYCLTVVFLCACESIPFSQVNSVDESPAVMSCSEHCPEASTLLTLSSQPCNLFAWQSFINWVLKSTEEERTNLANVLDMQFPPDQIKNLILISASEASYSTITSAHHDLHEKASILNAPLKSMLLGYILQNKQKLALTQDNQRAREENEALKKHDALLKEQLWQLQTKIDALTKIEQQINDGTPRADHTEVPDHD